MREMHDEDVVDRLSPYMDGELPARETEEVRRELVASPERRMALARLERLTRLSRAFLRAPPVSPAEWGARRAGIDRAVGPRVLEVAARRERSAQRVLVRFALAAVFLLCASLVFPLLVGDFGADRGDGLTLSRAPGANQAEFGEAWNERTDWWIHVDWPEADGTDPIVIHVSKV